MGGAGVLLAQASLIVTRVKLLYSREIGLE